MKSALMHRSLVLAAAAMAIAACGPTTINANLGASPSPSTGATSTSPAPGGSPTTSASSSPTTGSSASPGTGTTGTVTVPQINGNFDFATAQAVKSGDTISGTSDTTNANFFKIALPAGKQDGVLKMTLTEHGDSWQPKLTLYGADKNELGGDYADDTTMSPFVDQVPVTQGATYYVKLDAASGTNTDFTLAFEFDPVLDVNEPNNSFDTATALTLGKATPFFIYGGLNTLDGNDLDYFKFDVPAGSTKLRVQMTDNSSSTIEKPYDASTQLSYVLYDSSKTELHSGYAANAQANVDESVDLTAAGTYYMKVYDSRNGRSLHEQSLTVTAQ